MNETARKALQGNLDFYLENLEQLQQTRAARVARLAQIDEDIAATEKYVRELKEVLGNDEREYSEGVECTLL